MSWISSTLSRLSPKRKRSNSSDTSGWSRSNSLSSGCGSLNSFTIGESHDVLEALGVYAETLLTSSRGARPASLPEPGEYTTSPFNLNGLFGEIPTLQCKWGGCRSSVQVDEKDILQHLIEDHNVLPISASAQRSRMQCLWRNCAKVHGGGISKLVNHIKQEHLEDHRVFCEYCDASVAKNTYNAHLFTDCPDAGAIGTSHTHSA